MDLPDDVMARGDGRGATRPVVALHAMMHRRR